jgi:hypothetical protein
MGSREDLANDVMVYGLRVKWPFSPIQQGNGEDKLAAPPCDSRRLLEIMG